MSSSNSSEAPNPGPEKKRRYLSAEKKFQLYLEAQDGKPVGELSVVFAIVLAVVFLHEHMTRQHWVGGLLVASGAVVLAWK